MLEPIRPIPPPPASIAKRSDADDRPAFFIVVLSLLVNFIGDGLRDAFDPRQKRVRMKKVKELPPEMAVGSSIGTRAAVPEGAGRGGGSAVGRRQRPMDGENDENGEIDGSQA